MKEFKERRKIKKRIYSKFTIVILILVALAMIRGTWGIFQKARASQQKLEVSKESYEELEERHGAIESQIGHLKTSSGIEEEVRTKFNMAKEGEHVIVLVEEKKDEIDVENQDEKKGFWSKILFWQD